MSLIITIIINKNQFTQKIVTQFITISIYFGINNKI